MKDLLLWRIDRTPLSRGETLIKWAASVALFFVMALGCSFVSILAAQYPDSMISDSSVFIELKPLGIAWMISIATFVLIGLADFLRIYVKRLRS